MKAPGQLWDLWDMYELNASLLHHAAAAINKLIAYAERIPIPQQAIVMKEADVNSCGGLVGNFLIIVKTLHVPVTKLTAEDLQSELKRGKLSYHAWGQQMNNLSETFRRELKTVKVFSLDTNRATFYGSPVFLLGPDVEKKFLSIIYDIEQGGKCYACDLTTAAAFHWIRSLEAGIKAMTRCLGIPDPTIGADRNWSNIARSLHSEIERRWPKAGARIAGDAQLFDRMYGAITAMQNPYRNETMHLSAKYTAPEALHIFEMVKGLMQQIAARMDENGDPKV